MPMMRFFIDAELKDSLSLTGPELHHLAHVMKVHVGQTVELVNGLGALAQAKVTAISKKEAILEVIACHQTPLQEPSLILALPLMRPSKLELIIEKCTELGADGFWLYPAHHSEKEDLSENQKERLNYIAISAMKQCGRLELPKIKLLGDIAEIFNSTYTVLFGDTRANAKKITPTEKAIFVTGPERGFSEKELKLLEEKASGICLHKNILRAETAPIAAICLLGNFK